MYISSPAASTRPHCYQHFGRPIDPDRERALTLARILIRRGGLLAESLTERGYLAVLCRYISEYGFNSEQLEVSDACYQKVVETGGNQPKITVYRYCTK